MTVEELLAEIAQIKEQITEPRTTKAITLFEKRLERFGGENDRELAAQVERIAAQDKQLGELERQLGVLMEQFVEKDKLIDDLRKAQETRVTRGTPTDIARSFRAVIDEFHAESLKAEDVGVAIKALDLEVKGLIEVDEQTTTLVLPTAGTAVDPTALSTLRVSFATVPVFPGETPAPQPAPGAPAPADAPTSKPRPRRAGGARRRTS
jgi:hypothetical protein